MREESDGRAEAERWEATAAQNKTAGIEIETIFIISEEIKSNDNTYRNKNQMSGGAVSRLWQKAGVNVKVVCSSCSQPVEFPSSLTN